MTSVLHGVPAPRTSADLPPALLAQADADADALADALHDGALQSLVVARYAADAAVRGADPALARAAVQEALVALRRVVWEMRPRTAAGLDAALHDLAVHRADGGDAVLLLDVDPRAAAALTPAAAAVAYRFVQRASQDAPVRVRLVREQDGVVVELDVQSADLHAENLRATAVGGTVFATPAGICLRLPLPRPASEEMP